MNQVSSSLKYVETKVLTSVRHAGLIISNMVTILIWKCHKTIWNISNVNGQFKTYMWGRWILANL